MNSVHPDAVFDTGLWTDDLVAERAAQYGVSPGEYRTRNLLSMEVTSAQVARSVVALCSDDFRVHNGCPGADRRRQRPGALRVEEIKGDSIFVRAS
ncbi:MAG: hypothetical protein CM1200mP26_21990 [Acidimicrobiales bacterium]|nr:MAG: hypothetical protein CM1200mP26_21990 [Acidimicrobiales bacterium]